MIVQTEDSPQLLKEQSGLYVGRGLIAVNGYKDSKTRIISNLMETIASPCVKDRKIQNVPSSDLQGNLSVPWVILSMSSTAKKNWRQ